MYQRLISSLQFGNRFCGIEHALKGDQDILYTTLLKKNKKKVELEAFFSSKTNTEITNKLSKNQPVFLVINNDQVLTRSLKNEQTDDLNLINKAFPNISISEFYYEIINQDNISFISICRKEYIDQLIKEYHNNNIYVISFSLGNSILLNTIRFIENSTISTSSATISSDNNLIKKIEYDQTDKETQYEVNGLNVSNTYILSLSSALSRLLNNFHSSINYQDKKDTLLDTHKQIRFFSYFLKIGLVFILGLLLINFFFFNFYYNEVQTLNGTSQINQTSKNEILKLSEDVNKAQKITEDILKSSTSKSTFYINAIVNSLPESILLSEINYQPLEKRIKDDKPIELNLNTIIVSGESNNSTQYSKWITLLENMNWIDKVTVESYNDSKTSASNFNIKINITP